jgi:putative solute:sodium symporter small subunit
LLHRKKAVYTPGSFTGQPLQGAGAVRKRRTSAGARGSGECGVQPSPIWRSQSMQLTEKHQEYWSKNLRITAILLVIWFVVTYVIGFFARDLQFNFFGWPFAFYMGAQGSLIIYVIIIWFYARYMNNLDHEYGVNEGEED